MGPSARQWVRIDWPTSGGQLVRRPTAVRTSSTALPSHRRTPRRHHCRRRELLSAAMLQPPAAAFGINPKACTKAASSSFLPPTESSLWSGCTVDESYGVSTHSSRVCGRVRAGKLTWVSLSVGQHSATAPAIVRAHIYLSANLVATLLQPRRLAPPLLLERLVRFKSDLNSYLEHVALQIGIQVCSLDSNGPRSERGRKSDLRQNASFSQILPIYVWTLPDLPTQWRGRRGKRRV